jgi:leucyl-tRNA synthetase
MSGEDIERYLIPINEKEHLESAVDFLQKEFNCKFSVHSCDDIDVYDPQSKAKFAVPWRPAIFVE